MALPPQLSELLGAPLSGAARLVVRHQRRSTFRWIVLLELLFGFLLFLCLLPFLVLLKLLTRDTPDAGAYDSGSSWSDRFYNHWHDLVLVALDPHQQALAEARQRLVCGTGTVVDATYLPGGQLRATCRAQSNETLPQELQGTELTTAQIGAVAAAALLVVIVATGGDDDSTTTTTGSTAASE